MTGMWPLSQMLKKPEYAKQSDHQKGSLPLYSIFTRGLYLVLGSIFKDE